MYLLSVGADNFFNSSWGSMWQYVVWGYTNLAYTLQILFESAKR